MDHWYKVATPRKEVRGKTEGVKYAFSFCLVIFDILILHSRNAE